MDVSKDLTWLLDTHRGIESITNTFTSCLKRARLENEVIQPVLFTHSNAHQGSGNLFFICPYILKAKYFSDILIIRKEIIFLA